MNKIKIKPLSVNLAWKGRRFKTQKYKDYEVLLKVALPNIKLPEPPYHIIIDFGFSNKGSDIDNPLKPFLDILQKKYNFNDKDIYQLTVKKSIVKKGNEYIDFNIKERELPK